MFCLPNNLVHHNLFLNSPVARKGYTVRVSSRRWRIDHEWQEQLQARMADRGVAIGPDGAGRSGVTDRWLCSLTAFPLKRDQTVGVTWREAENMHGRFEELQQPLTGSEQRAKQSSVGFM